MQSATSEDALKSLLGLATGLGTTAGSQPGPAPRPPGPIYPSQQSYPGPVTNTNFAQQPYSPSIASGQVYAQAPSTSSQQYGVGQAYGPNGCKPPPPSQQQQQQQPYRPAPIPDASFGGPRQAAPAQSNHHFVSAPLMPSVILNKARTGSSQTAAASSSGSSSSGTAPISPQYQHGYAQPAPILQRAQSPPVLRAKSPLRQSYTYRMGAESIPPPPVPPVESRPIHPHQSSSRDASPNRLTANEPAMAAAPQAGTSSPSALDLLNEQLKKTSLYQPPQPHQAYSVQPVILDRYAFRTQVMHLLQVRLIMYSVVQCSPAVEPAGLV